MKTFNYVVVTPAHNESDFIEDTIQSVISQTHLPLRWVIVSDGSTDGTDDIVKRYIRDYPWIDLIRIPERKERHFAAKVNAFQTGFNSISGLDFDVVANVDADISFEPDHFKYLLDKFSELPNLGVAGTAFAENGKIAYDYNFTNIEHVSGQCQVFRRQCFEDIGGYQPVKGGGIDWIAVTTARMKGWQTRTFADKYFIHHRTMGTGTTNAVMAYFKHGQKDYLLGGHPLWQLFRSLYQMTKRPYLIGGTLLFLGYATSKLRMLSRPISNELVKFCQAEQMKRLRAKFKLTEPFS